MRSSRTPCPISGRVGEDRKSKPESSLHFSTDWADFLMFIIKATGQSTFGDNIDLLDEMSICDIKPGHYAEVNLTKEEAELLKTGR